MKKIVRLVVVVAFVVVAFVGVAYAVRVEIPISNADFLSDASGWAFDDGVCGETIWTPNGDADAGALSLTSQDEFCSYMLLVPLETGKSYSLSMAISGTATTCFVTMQNAEISTSPSSAWMSYDVGHITTTLATTAAVTLYSIGIGTCEIDNLRLWYDDGQPTAITLSSISATGFLLGFSIKAFIALVVAMIALSGGVFIGMRLLRVED